MHPLNQLSVSELETTVRVLKAYHDKHLLHIKIINRQEPPKSKLIPHLEAEKAGKPLPKPLPRIAQCVYYVMDEKKACECFIDIGLEKVIKFSTIPKGSHLPLDFVEAGKGLEVCLKHSAVVDALKKCGVDTDGDVMKCIDADGWMYGCDQDGDVSRYFMFLLYARNPKTNHQDSNLYSFPLPIVPVYDVLENKFVRVDWVASGDKNDDSQGFNYNTRTPGKNLLEEMEANEYIPELMDEPIRTDLKPYNVVQPEGPSFTVDEDNLVQWQKWRFRVGFTPREGLVLHDISYDGRNTFYRLSMSEMAVPYADPRPPVHRKMAFDFGDVGGGKCANELELGCDCLGTIKYLDGNLVDPDGTVVTRKSVICLHEQDDGLLWKHTNYRTNVARVVRRRVLVVQMILTVGNYEYIFAWHFDQAAGIQLEIRASGVVSTQYIDEGKKSEWGTIVSPGVLAPSHQHIFNVRIDPAIDGYKNTAVVQDTHVVPWDVNNPYGTGFKNVGTYLEISCAVDADLSSNRYIKIVNESIKNPISGNPVGYKLMALPSTLLLAQEGSVARKRAAFATHNFWISKYKDQELYAGGVWTNQSYKEVGGVQDAVDRKDDIRNEDIILWHSFGLTHHPRVEDFPVMPVEIIKVGLHPADFFTKSPAIDVPQSTQQFNRSVDVMAKRSCHL